jgi:hypothetical protein
MTNFLPILIFFIGANFFCANPVGRNIPRSSSPGLTVSSAWQLLPAPFMAQVPLALRFKNHEPSLIGWGKK